MQLGKLGKVNGNLGNMERLGKIDRVGGSNVKMDRLDEPQPVPRRKKILT